MRAQIAGAALAALLGAACSGSSPVTVATGEVEPTALAAQGGNVYWLAQASATAPAAVRTASASGGAPSTLAGVAQPRALALGSTDAIVGTSGGNVYKTPLSGGGALTVLIPKNGTDPVLAVAVHGDFAYAAFNSARLARASISTGMSSVQELDSTNNKLIALAADDAFLYWTTQAGDVFRQAADGTGTATLLGNLLAVPLAAAAISGDAFFAPTSQAIGEVPEGAGTLATVLQGGSSCPPPRACTFTFWGLASSSAGLFIGLTHGIAKLDPSTGGSPIVVSTDDGTSLAADSGNVYWIGSETVDSTGSISTAAIYRAGF